MLYSVLQHVITIDEQLTWTMGCSGNPVEKQECRLLKSNPNKLTDVTTLLHIIISDSRLCRGNAAVDFQDAVSANGNFRNHAGTKCISDLE